MDNSDQTRFLRFLKSPAGQAALLEEVRRVEAARAARRAYFESPAFNGLVERFNAAAASAAPGQYIEPPCTEEEFRSVFESIFETQAHRIVDDPASDFPVSHVDYKGLRFELMIGQGSSYSLCRAPAP